MPITVRLSYITLISLTILAIIFPYLSSYNPYNLSQSDLTNSLIEPMQYGVDHELFIFGTDALGRDLLSTMIFGLRLSLFVGLLSGCIAFFLGSIIGLIAGFYGGRLDSVIMRLVDLFLSLPTLMLALIFVSLLGKGIDKIIFALILIQWAYFARAIRSTVLVEMKKNYISVLKNLEIPSFNIIFFHLLPNCLPPLFIVGAVQVAGSIGLEATLSFLGIGLPITSPSLGNLISNGFDYLLSNHYWISLFPGLLLMILLFCIHTVCDYLRQGLNPKLRQNNDQ